MQSEPNPERNTLNFTRIDNTEGRSVLLLWHEDGEPEMVTESHPNYIHIALALHEGNDPAEWLDPNFSPESGIFDLSDRVSLIDGVLHFDGDAVYNGLAETIKRYRRDQRDPTNLVRFMERLSANPSYRSREQLFTWTEAKELTIDTDGFIIAHKGVNNDLTSVASGTAWVDGVPFTGNIPNDVGSVISMPRPQVNDDPNHGCSSGLHVGSWGYASSWGSNTVEVRIDPKDVVSVPADCNFAKMRVCEYEVIAGEARENLADFYEPEAAWDVDEAWDTFTQDVPKGFVNAIRNRLRNRGRS